MPSHPINQSSKNLAVVKYITRGEQQSNRVLEEHTKPQSSGRGHIRCKMGCNMLPQWW